MTETEWLAATVPGPMVRHLDRHVPEAGSLLRRTRLAAVACCRDVPAAVMPADGPALLAAVEAWVDAGGRRPAAVGRLERVVQAAADRSEPGWRDCLHAGRYSARPFRRHQAAAAVAVTALSCRSRLDRAMVLSAAIWACDAHPRPAAARGRAADLLRCVFGNPFRPARVAPGWRTAAVLALARAVYAERAFDRLPILADALEDAGCDDPDILAHCRGGGPHARGCRAVDALLGNP